MLLFISVTVVVAFVDALDVVVDLYSLLLDRLFFLPKSMPQQPLVQLGGFLVLTNSFYKIYCLRKFKY